MSYSSLQLGMQEFRHPAFHGFVPYMTIWGVDYVLGNPITCVDDYPVAIQLFLERHSRVMFCQVDRYCAVILSCYGAQVSPLGVEHIISLQNFQVTWKQRRGLKRFCSRLQNLKYYVFENAGMHQQADDISEVWLLSRRSSKELRFLARPYNGTKEEDVRIFYLVKDSRLVGFASFDPVYSGDDGRPTSYVLQHLRTSDEAPNGVGDYLIVSALQQFKDEGLEEASLGLAPLYQREDRMFTENRGVRLMGDWLYKTKFLYHFADLGEHKSRYHGLKRQTYMAAFPKFTLRGLGGMLRANNLI